MKNIIFHFASDEKFIDNAITKFESVSPGGNRYIVIHRASPPEFVKSTLAERWRQQDALKLIRSGECKIVIFHGLSADKVRLLHHLRPETRIAWLGWGFDYYPTLLRHAFPTGLFEPMTLPLAQAAGRASLGRLAKLRRWVKGAWRHRSTQSKAKLQKVDIFTPILHSEWKLSRQLNPWFKAEYMPWYYATPPEEQWSSTYSTREKRNILIGNSADLTNNHIDAFAAVASQVHPKHYDRIIVPLGYGRSSITTQRIEDAGRHYFKERFTPLKHFLAIDEYRNILASCHTMVLNHIRQQGAGNASLAAQAGTRIVLNASSLLRGELDRRGITYETISDFGIGKLDQRTMRSNREAELTDIRYRADPQKTLNLINFLTK